MVKTMATQAKPFRVDTTQIGLHGLRARIHTAFEELGWKQLEYDHFWGRFPKHTGQLPSPLIVLADLAHLARRYLDEDRHQWIASARRTHVYFVACVRTRQDEHFAHLVDDLIRATDWRLSVCRTERASDVRACLGQAVAAFDPTTLKAVGYVTDPERLLVEFSDGLAGFITWQQLRVDPDDRGLVRESATMGRSGKTIELAQRGDGVFEIDSASVRALLDPVVAKSIARQGEDGWQRLGSAVRATRQRIGLTQTQLGDAAGMDQALISKLEKGQHQPRFDTVQRIAASMGVSVSELLGASVG